MKRFDDRYVKLAYVIFRDCYTQISTSNLPVMDVTITIPVDLSVSLGYSPTDREFKIFNVVPSDPSSLLDKVHDYFITKLHIGNKAVRDLYIGSGLSMMGIVKYAESASNAIVFQGTTGEFMNLVLIDVGNQVIFDSMLTNTLVMNREFYSYVNWLVMAASARSRATNRMWRYMGM